MRYSVRDTPDVASCAPRVTVTGPVKASPSCVPSTVASVAGTVRSIRNSISSIPVSSPSSAGVTSKVETIPVHVVGSSGSGRFECGVQYT